MKNYTKNKDYKEDRQWWNNGMRQQKDPAGWNAFKQREQAWLALQEQNKNNKGKGGNKDGDGDGDGKSTPEGLNVTEGWGKIQQKLVKEGDPITIEQYQELTNKYGVGRVDEKLFDSGKLKMTPQLQKHIDQNPTLYSDKLRIPDLADKMMNRQEISDWAQENAEETTGPSSIDGRKDTQFIFDNYQPESMYTGKRLETKAMVEAKKKWENTGKKGGPGYSQYVDDEGNFQSRLGKDGKLKYDKDGNKYNLKMPVKSEDNEAVTNAKNQVTKLYDALGINERPQKGQMKKAMNRLKDAMAFEPTGKSTGFKKRTKDYTKTGNDLLGKLGIN